MGLPPRRCGHASAHLPLRRSFDYIKRDLLAGAMCNWMSQPAPLVKPDGAWPMTQDDVKRMIASALGLPADGINDSTRAGDIEEWDSMGTMSILVMLDSDFDVRLAPNETATVQSVEGILGLLRRTGKLA
jgi:acyl carrier protein